MYFFLFSRVYDSPYLLQFIGDKGQQYIATHSIDRIGAAVSMDRLLPDEKVKWSVNDLEDWFNSSKSVDLFKGLDIYKVLSSKCLEKANVLPYLFLVSHCEGPITYECAPNGTPLGQNGSTLAEKFLWWSTLYHGAVKLIKMADNNIKHVHIWNEPNAVSSHIIDTEIHPDDNSTFCSIFIMMDTMVPIMLSSTQQLLKD